MEEVEVEIKPDSTSLIFKFVTELLLVVLFCFSISQLAASSRILCHALNSGRPKQEWLCVTVKGREVVEFLMMNPQARSSNGWRNASGFMMMVLQASWESLKDSKQIRRRCGDV